MGTIVGNKDIDCIRWPGSEWRCLEVTSCFHDFKMPFGPSTVFCSYSILLLNDNYFTSYFSFQVKWDATPDTFLHPERVSPWNIELIESTYKRSTSIISEQNRKRPVNPSLSECSCLSRDGLYPTFILCSEFQTLIGRFLCISESWKIFCINLNAYIIKCNLFSD